MTWLEVWARNLVIAALGVGAGYISLGHVYDFVMKNSLPGTDPTTGIIVAVVSELMPIGVALHYRITGRLGPFAVFLLLLAGSFSLWAQIATAKPGVAGYAVAAFTTLAFMGLVKLMLSHAKHGDARPEQPPVELPEPGAATPIRRATIQLAPPAHGVSELVAEPGPAATTGEAASGPDDGATPPSPAANGGDNPGRSAASRAMKVAAVQAARRELGKTATQAQIAKKIGCSTATVSRIESQLRPPGSGEPEERPLVLTVVKAG